MTQREMIRDFLACPRIAFVGVSSQPQDFSRTVFHELVQRGYDVVPVNPKVAEVEGRPAYAHVQDIPVPVDAVLVMTPHEVSEIVMNDCARAGVHRVWLHRGAGRGAVSDAALRAGEQHGMSVVAGECPMMFLDESAWPHRLHAWGRKLLGRYPS
jgi:predicted CoA-binding protein